MSTADKLRSRQAVQSNGVQVVVRLRPLNSKEKREGTLPVVTCNSERKEVAVIKGAGMRAARSAFRFDNVFSLFTTQEEIFDQTLRPMIDDVMKGYESTVFAYGQVDVRKWRAVTRIHTCTCTHAYKH